MHFGSLDPGILPALAQSIGSAKPDVVVVSGDLTQRARARQFQDAQEFLQALPGAKIVVPGNHDVPLYNVFARWLTPLDNFRRYVTADLEPYYSDSEIAVLGLNTARSWTFKNGRINTTQVAASCRRFGALDKDVVRIVVTHHPFSLPDTIVHSVVGRSQMAIEGFAACQVDIILSGHLHLSHTALSVERYKDTKHAALLVQAGTATSSRRRGETNSFNVLRVEYPKVNIDRLLWNDSGHAFERATTTAFELTASGWNALNGGSRP